ncbi:hypothetical protein [Chryseobacterium sp. GP-SGM7]|uniref:hypothetical protein n=1 Tax=Chryseobacterium sp. GP-SGM7 TaxID=3411323 RepID=UPI003B95010C
MKLLVITPCVGRNASGFVFEKIIRELSQYNEIDVLTYDYAPLNNMDQVHEVIVCEKKYIHPRIVKGLISLFHANPIDFIWTQNAKKNLKDKNKSYDLVFSFLHSHQYTPLIAGIDLSSHFNSKLAVYAIDALPPRGWEENKLYFRAVEKIMHKYLSKADALFSSNEIMLEYQLNLLKTNKKIMNGVIYTPAIIDHFTYLPEKKDPNNNFVFTGGIYGVRKVNYLLEGFEKLLLEFPESNLIFVGSTIDSSLLKNYKSETLEKVKIYPFTKDLFPYYESATALIDIDADIENDLFLSSKIVNYLKVDRIIISETGNNSPSRLLFKDINSIIQCHHNSEELYSAMKSTILRNTEIKYDDRASVSDLFSLPKIVQKLNKFINELIIS